MKKKDKIILFCFLAETVVVFLSFTVDLVVFHLSARSILNAEISLKVLKTVQSITVCPLISMFLVSLFCKVRKYNLAEKIPQNTKSKIVIFIWLCSLILLFLILLIDFSGRPVDEFNLGRDHTLVVCLSGFLFGLTGWNLGFNEILRLGL